MEKISTGDNTRNTQEVNGQSTAMPSINLPKGGGAIRGIGEKFSANPATGTGSLNVPIATTPGRSNFSPSLNLSYNSGSGNGPFGIGWSLSLPSVTRKTDKGLPRYNNSNKSDMFILSGAEDLVPVLYYDKNKKKWESKSEDKLLNGIQYSVKKYRPRTEGLFARIECWTDKQSGYMHWRSISLNNITTIYGKDKVSRIYDPLNPENIFSWLICESYDDKGNAILYEYAAEDSQNVQQNLKIHEKNRTDILRAANRYIKRIKYGNKISRLIQPNLSAMEWCFEVVFDYDEGHYLNLPAGPNGHDNISAFLTKQQNWSVRKDTFSVYKPGFELRTYRLCRRVLIFHHFKDELGTEDYLVRSSEFRYKETPVASFIMGITQSGFVRKNDGKYIKKSLPEIEFEYTQPEFEDTICQMATDSLDNLPIGIDNSNYQWIDLNGEGLSGVLTDQGDAWYYKSNLGNGKLDSSREVKYFPSIFDLKSGRQHLMDLAGDGEIELVQFDDPLPGFFERKDNDHWDLFRPFESCPNIHWDNPNMKLIDITGDGHTDILITEDNVFTWYHSLAEKGFGSSGKTFKFFDEESCPALLFADINQSVYLADFSGDGLSDIVRIRNGEICYWPNMGYGNFGKKIAMDNSPLFDLPDQFDQRRIRLADIDGSGTTDVIYLRRHDIALYFNQSGNGWSGKKVLNSFPETDNLSSVNVIDLKGNGTACITWSSGLPGTENLQLRYIDLTGGIKPHLMKMIKNNMGAETRIQYSASTKFYLEDKEKGKPWITKLPFPVHVVERVEVYDRISRSRFTTRYAYHHGYFDGIDREFRGFGMVDSWDTEEIANIKSDEISSSSLNLGESSFVPPVRTKSWFHTGAYTEGTKISGQYEKEYYREPGKSGNQFQKMLLPDTVLPKEILLEGGTTLSIVPGFDEMREACRALRGQVLRTEVYAEDDCDKSDTPYSVSEMNYAIKWLQPGAFNQPAVFFTHPLESIEYHYERNSSDPRTGHRITLKTDNYGNILESAEIGYGRRLTDSDLGTRERNKQKKNYLIYTENNYTNEISDENNYRTPLLCETKTYELSGLQLSGDRFSIKDVTDAIPISSEISYETEPDGSLQKRLIEHVRTVYRKNDLSGALPAGKLESLGLSYNSYKLAFTQGLLKTIFIDSQKISSTGLDNELKNNGAYKSSDQLKTEGILPNTAVSGEWWIPGNRVYYSAQENHTAAQELSFAKNHFFLPHRNKDPFDESIKLAYDKYDLLLKSTIDPLGNTITVQSKDEQGNNFIALDYRVLQPWLIVDENDNRSAVSYDALGMVAGTAVMGKVGENKGDSLESFEPDLSDAVISAHIQKPFTEPDKILKKATTRLVYDLHRYKRTCNNPNPQPNVIYTMARERHDSDLSRNDKVKIQHTFEFSDGFGRQIQTKIQAEKGNAPKRKANTTDPDRPGELLLENGKPKIEFSNIRWTGTGRILYNNKGKPVKKYEPFFSITHLYEEEADVTETGVTPILFYDPIGRVIATLQPDHSYEKVIFDPWKVETWDVNDTVLLDPATDTDISELFNKLKQNKYSPSWYQARKNGQLGNKDKDAAIKTAKHASTTQKVYLDSLGRTILTVDDNGKDSSGQPMKFETAIDLDIEGSREKITDARGNVVMYYNYDIAGNAIFQDSMDAGKRWMLNNVLGNPVRMWDERSHEFFFSYDELRRPVKKTVKGGDGTNSLNNVFEVILYGDRKNLSASERAASKAKNFIGKPVLQYDTAGKIVFDEYDFKSNLLISSRFILKDFKSAVNWSGNNLDSKLEPDAYTISEEYDALNRVICSTAPDGSRTSPTYNEASLLETISILKNGSATPFVKNIDYNEKGQRESITYGNDITTKYEYDKKTFRLIHQKTNKSSNRILQDLYYTYDPTGNITCIEDKAIPVEFNNNQKTDGKCEYEYDPTYRLIKASGREQIASVMFGTEDNWSDTIFQKKYGSGDTIQTQPYSQEYQYDESGNMIKLIHKSSGNNWTRKCSYENKNNRIKHSLIGNTKYNYTHHSQHGFTTSMPHLQLMTWNFKDELQSVAKQKRSDGGSPETTYYIYDSGGQRVRKVIENSAGPGATPSKKNDRIYIGNFELYREYSNGMLDKERETLHVEDDNSRIALIETLTKENAAPANEILIRYQFSNHLGSAVLETDDKTNAQIISYEEYHPYGTTAYRALSKDIKAAAKRYRYTGKERDEENGFYYHGARYYISWLGRWLSCDPIGIEDGINVYTYAKNNPIIFMDPNGNNIAADIWNSAVEGSRIITGAINRGTAAAGDYVFEKAMSASRKLEKSGYTRLSTGLKYTGIVGATLVKTVGEVGGQAVASGPNLVLGMNDAGTNIGEGAARIATARNYEETLLGVAQVSGGMGQAALTVTEVVSLKRGAAIARQKIPRAAPGEYQSTVNRRFGNEFSSKVAKQQKSVTTEVSEQLQIQPLEAPRTGNIGPLAPARKASGKPLKRIVDVAQKSKISKRLRFSEVKSTSTAEYNAQQQTADRLMEQFGGIVRSQKTSVTRPLGLSYGEAIGPVKTDLLRNTTIGNRYLVPALCSNQALNLMSTK